jgi:hypothetical protein
LDALPTPNGMAFIIVQHLDPSHDSMMVDLLAGHTAMPVLLATEGMKIECERVYVPASRQRRARLPVCANRVTKGIGLFKSCSLRLRCSSPATRFLHRC